MHLRILHRTTFTYAGKAQDSFNEVRLRPMNSATQHCREFALHLSPTAAPLDYDDFHGNTIHYFDLAAPHAKLVIEAVSTVDTTPLTERAHIVVRTQGGNNNGYCQDNTITWVDWADIDEELLAFVRTVAALRAEHPVFRRRRFFTGHPVRQIGSTGLPDISWFRPDGSEMTEADWDTAFDKSIAVYLNGQGIPDLDPRGHRVTDDSFLICFNAHFEPIQFTLPPAEFGARWRIVVDTANPQNGSPNGEAALFPPGGSGPVQARSLVVLQAVSD